MIISHQHRFIFIKTQKTAGTSLELHLAPFLDRGDVITTLEVQARNWRGFYNPLPPLLAARGLRQRYRELRRFVGLKKFPGHMPAHEVRRLLPAAVWDGYFKFCVERNPWDKTLSMYHFLTKFSLGHHHPDMSFDEYLATGKLPLDFDMYTDPANGEVIVDEVLKFETLQQDLARILPKIGIPTDGQMTEKANAEFRNDRRSYSEVYSPQQAEVVRQAFRRETELLGYAF